MISHARIFRREFPLSCIFRIWRARARQAIVAALVLFACHILAAQSNTGATVSAEAETTNACGAADQALASGLWQSAINNYLDCLKINPDSSAVFSNMGVAYSHLGRMPDAVNSYVKALALDPSNIKIEFNLAITDIKSGDYTSAVELLKHLQRSDKDLRYDELLAFCYYHLESYSLAARSAEKVYEVHPDNAGNALILGSAYTRMGLYEKAVPLITLALKAAGSAEGHLILAQTLLGMHQYKSAEDELNQATAIQPDLPGLHTAMGDVYLGFEKTPEAEAEFALALKEDPNDFEANYLLGRLKRFDKDIPTAKKYLDIADQLHPRSAEVMYERAEIALSEQRYADAVPLLESVIKAQPDNAQAYLMLAESYQKTGRRAEAQKEGELYNAKRRELHEKKAEQQ
jgi:tetratricopeptide (TPR) repeat protein